SRVSSWANQRPSPDMSVVSNAVEMVLKAKRPILWLGNGINRSNASEAALRFAEAFNVPIITTFNGMGCVATNHPLVFGALTRMGTTLASRVLKDADLVLAVGNSLNAVSTSRWQLD